MLQLRLERHLTRSGMDAQVKLHGTAVPLRQHCESRGAHRRFAGLILAAQEEISRGVMRRRGQD
eukprot:611070-Prymnesium_polylepis.1